MEMKDGFMKNQKGFTLVEGLLIVLISSVVGFAGYMVWDNNKSEDGSTEVTTETANETLAQPNESELKPEQQEEPPEVENSFSLDNVEAGDRVGSMTLVEKDLQSALFNGHTEVTGSYRVDIGDELLGSIWCIEELSADSLKLIPKESSDERGVWFCFNNNQKASALLGDESKDSVTVVIDDYFIDLKQSSVYNTATLVEVL